MSEQPHASHAVRTEPDSIAAGRIALIGVASLVLFFLASVASTMVFRAKRAELNPDGPPPLPGEAGKAKIGIVEQQLFENVRTGARFREEELQRLSTWGWVDRRAGIVHEPVERSMERVLRGERP
jgi:hypothetical protein